MTSKPNNTVTGKDFDGNAVEIETSKLEWRPGAYGIVVKDNHLLLLRQINGYDLPGGGVELGESLDEAVIREVKEETGTKVANPQLVATTTSFYKAFRSTDKYWQALMIYYRCDYVSGELSSEGFDEGEQQYAEAPEWLPLSKLDDITIGSSIDFRPYVKQALSL